MKVVLTIFLPIFYALLLRFVLALIGAIPCGICYALDLDSMFGISFDAWINFFDIMCEFNAFDLEESWGYWLLVLIGTFLIEAGIWSDE